MKDVDELIADLYESYEADRCRVSFTSEEKELIHEIASMCEAMPIVQSRLVQKVQDEAYKSARNLSPEDYFAAITTALLKEPNLSKMEKMSYILMPVVDRKLREED